MWKLYVSTSRSALPQHFNTTDGHHVEGAASCSARPLPPDRDGLIQNYNREYERVFSRSCGADDDVPDSAPCQGRHVVFCTLPARDTGIRSVYRFLSENNLTDRLGRYEGMDEFSGRVHRWDIADLFNVPLWHIADTDCSHFCFVPRMFELAFHRLNLLLSM